MSDSQATAFSFLEPGSLPHPTLTAGSDNGQSPLYAGHSSLAASSPSSATRNTPGLLEHSPGSPGTQLRTPNGTSFPIGLREACAFCDPIFFRSLQRTLRLPAGLYRAQGSTGSLPCGCAKPGAPATEEVSSWRLGASGRWGPECMRLKPAAMAGRPDLPVHMPTGSFHKVVTEATAVCLALGSKDA